MWKDIRKDGDIGSEGGIVLLDEEYKDQCRITLERCRAYYAITCGVYGSMVHTAFCDEKEYQLKYERMKLDLQNFMDTDTTWDEELEFYDAFSEKY
ncbi:MAG: hypothetical protein LUC47_08020 [Clostridiales bacterium]|nr:hypothetical protein [Clostridiales bacterium]